MRIAQAVAWRAGSDASAVQGIRGRTKHQVTGCAAYGGDWITRADLNWENAGFRQTSTPFGLSDLFGNVFEWTEDCWHASNRSNSVGFRLVTG